ncbi:MAG: class I SAM-dependent methyltransferase [Planctomycetota bacterium]|nr:class I SAM-dependent methyltransferase [Planctomycetota bacterium]
MNPETQGTGSRKLSLKRVGRNLSRILGTCTPPVIQRLFDSIRKPVAESPQVPLPEEEQVIEFLLPRSLPEQIWEEFEQTEITMIPRQIRDHLWAMPENELMVLSTLCQLLRPQRVFEFGTFTGASTLAMAANTPETTRIQTLDIPPENRRSHRTGVGSDIPFDFEIGEVFQGTRWQEKIQILKEDARDFDTRPYRNRMDLVFVDADHTYEFVRNDSSKAMEMLAPGGVILWHDYRWDDESPECAGVTRFVNEFHSQTGHCLEIEGTRFAIYQSTEAGSQTGRPTSGKDGVAA